MQNSIFNKVNVSTRILALILLSLSILVAKSIYLMIFFLIFLIILVILTNKSVKFYIDSIKKVKFWLLFIFLTYIIVFRNILDSCIFIYKVILIIFIFKQFSLTVNFESLSNGIRTLLKPLRKLNLDKLAYDIVVFIYFVNEYLNSKKEIFSNYNYDKKIRYTFSLKYNIFPRIFFAISKINKLESSLKLKFYKSSNEEKNIASNMVLFIFIMLFIVVVFKEVIL